MPISLDRMTPSPPAGVEALLREWHASNPSQANNWTYTITTTPPKPPGPARTPETRGMEISIGGRVIHAFKEIETFRYVLMAYIAPTPLDLIEIIRAVTEFAYNFPSSKATVPILIAAELPPDTLKLAFQLGIQVHQLSRKLDASTS